MEKNLLEALQFERAQLWIFRCISSIFVVFPQVLVQFVKSFKTCTSLVKVALALPSTSATNRA